MNERIRQLAEESGITDNNLSDGNMSHNDLKKFAELIVRECAQLADDASVSGPPTGYTYGNVICEHFGVEE